jgi:hypothetical protein
MRIFTTKWFTKWAAKERLTDEALRTAVAEMEQGLIEQSGWPRVQETGRSPGER